MTCAPGWCAGACPATRRCRPRCRLRPTRAPRTVPAGEVLHRDGRTGLAPPARRLGHRSRARGDRGHRSADRPGRAPRCICASGSPPPTRRGELAAVAAELGPMVIALHDAGVGAANLMAVYSAARRRAHPPPARARARRRPAPAHAFAWLSLGSQARRESLPALRRRQRDGVVRARRRTRSEPRWSRSREGCRDGLRAAGCARTRTARAPADPVVRALAGLLAAAVARLDRRPHPGQGADPRLGARRQPAGVGGAHGHTGGRHLPPRRSRPDAAAPAGALCAVAPAADGLPARTGGRARRRAPRPSRPQARRRDPDRRPRSLGGHGGRGHNRLHAGAAARCRAAPGSWRPPTWPRSATRSRSSASCASGTRSHSCAPAQRPTTISTRPSSRPLMRTQLKEAFRAVAAVQKRLHVRAQPRGGLRGTLAPMRGDWHDFRPAIWLAMLGIALRCALPALRRGGADRRRDRGGAAHEATAADRASRPARRAGADCTADRDPGRTRGRAGVDHLDRLLLALESPPRSRLGGRLGDGRGVRGLGSARARQRRAAALGGSAGRLVGARRPGNVAGLLLAYRAMRAGRVALVAPVLSSEGAMAALIAILVGESIAPRVGVDVRP